MVRPKLPPRPTPEDPPMAYRSLRRWHSLTGLFDRALSTSRSHKPAARPHSTALAVELLEDRTVPSLTVTTFADVVNPNDGRLSLREAIQQANSRTTQPNAAQFDETITFQSAGTVNLQSALPEVTGHISMDNQTGGAVTVRRASSAAFSIFRVAPGGTL